MNNTHNGHQNPQQSQSLLKVTGASMIGTTLEFYDHFIYGTAAALVFPKVFFPEVTPPISLALSLATYGIAFVARPLGAVIFGHFGDKLGRKDMLVLALCIMGVATFLIGCLPSYATSGTLGAIMLCLLRLAQGIALGGEWGGAALMVAEYAKNSPWRAFLGSMVQCASPIGFLLASGVFMLLNSSLSETDFFHWGWRIPFLLSIFLVVTGLYLRSNIEESPEFLQNASKVKSFDSAPVARVMRHHWRRLLLAIGTRIGSDIAFYVFALFPLVYLPTLGMPKQVALHAAMAAAVGQAVGIPIFGYFSDKFSTRSVLAVGAVANIIWVFVFFQLLATQNPTLILVAAFVALCLLAALWAPLAAHLPMMFPVDVRFTGAGVGFQAAGILGGALAPQVCLGLLQLYNSTTPVSLYLSAFLLLALLCTLLTPTYSRTE